MEQFPCTFSVPGAPQANAVRKLCARALEGKRLGVVELDRTFESSLERGVVGDDPGATFENRSGTTVNIQIPGRGNVLADRGTITIDFTTDPWTVLH